MLHSRNTGKSLKNRDVINKNAIDPKPTKHKEEVHCGKANRKPAEVADYHYRSESKPKQTWGNHFSVIAFHDAFGIFNLRSPTMREQFRTRRDWTMRPPC
jgi:hypothetical protein